MKKKKLTPDEEYDLYRYRRTRIAWKDMLRRCYNEKREDYKYYGGRGISVDAAWFNWETFLHDMGLKPTGAHSLDRINNDGDYAPGNCRWANAWEQAQNKSNSRKNRSRIRESL